MPEPGMGASNDHSSSNVGNNFGGGFGGGDWGSNNSTSSNNTTAENLSSSNTTSDNLASNSSNSDLYSPTTAESLANSPTTADTLARAPERSYYGIPTSAESQYSRVPNNPVGQQSGESSDDTGVNTNSSVVGITGAVARESAVQGVLNRSYQAGLNAPQESYQGPVHRGSPTAYEDGALGYEHSRTGRYHAEGQHAVYGAPTQAGAIRELSIYETDQNRTYTEFDVDINPDAVSGNGGVSDIRAGLRQQNLPESVLTQPSTGSASSTALHTLTGEHRYNAPQQTGKGAIDAGAAAIRAPSAIGDTQIDFLPANADASTITPVGRQTLTPAGDLGPVRSAATVDPMPAYRTAITDGPLDMSAGTANRASSARYGAVGGIVDTFVQTGVDLAQGNEVNAQDVAVATGVNTAIGAGAARATDLLAPRIGMVRSGGVIGGAIQATVSGYTNYQDYSAGEITGERAIANTIVDTGTAVAAGATGAAAGALVGSVVPVAGTAVGAVAGFAVGVGAHYAIQAVDSVTGFTDSAKESLANGLESAGDWLKSWW